MLEDAAIAADWLRAFIESNDEMKSLLHVSVLADQSNTFDFEGNVLVLLVPEGDAFDDDLLESRGHIEFELEGVLGRSVEVMAVVAPDSSAGYFQLPMFDAVAAHADLIYGRSIADLRRSIEH